MKYVLELLTQTRNPFEISRKLAGVSPTDVRHQMHDLEELPGWGKLELQRHILSRRKAYAPNWPIEDQQMLLEHRRMHDQGRTTMCQGRDGEWIIQYSILAKRLIKRSPYFYGG